MARPGLKLPHFAVLWAKIGVNGYGQPLLAAPIEIRCRWETASGAKAAPTGNVDVEVFVPVAIAEGSVMWKGKLADVPNPNVTSAFGEVSLYEVLHLNAVDDLKGRHTCRSVKLMRKDSQVPVAG